MTEAHRDSCNGLDYGVLSFGLFCIWLVTWVSRILLLYNVMTLSLKQIDVYGFFVKSTGYVLVVLFRWNYDGIIMFFAIRYNSDYQIHVMGHVPYAGWATNSRATVMTHLFCMLYIYIKKKKNRASQYAFAGSYTNGQRGSYTDVSLDRSGSFPENGESCVFGSTLSSRGNATSTEDLPPLSEWYST
jgi:hypothetical protein